MTAEAEGDGAGGVEIGGVADTTTSGVAEKGGTRHFDGGEASQERCLDRWLISSIAGLFSTLEARPPEAAEGTSSRGPPEARGGRDASTPSARDLRSTGVGGFLGKEFKCP